MIISPGTMTILTAAVTWAAGVGTATFSPPNFNRYLAVAMASSGAPTALGSSNIVCSMLDVRRQQQYILNGSSTSSPVRGVPLRHLASLGAVGAGPRWRGTWADTLAFLQQWLSHAAAEKAAIGLRKYFGEPEPDVAFIPVDSDFTVTLVRQLSGDEPATLSLVVIDMGQGDESAWSQLVPFGRPYWFPFTAVSLATAAVVSNTLNDKLVIPQGRYVDGGIKGSMLHRTSLGSIFLDSDGSLDLTQQALVSVGSATQDFGKSRFEPALAPIQLAANPLSPMLPVWDRRFLADATLSLDYSKAGTAAAAKLFFTEQFVASRMPQGG